MNHGIYVRKEQIQYYTSSYHKIPTARKIDENRDIYTETFLPRKIEQSQTKPSETEKSMYVEIGKYQVNFVFISSIYFLVANNPSFN